ncbi:MULTISPECIES: NADP-dependent oxidoreductase [Priestia]|uniref:NADP-dependent oxidoreductase n=1 Tax=Priestia TaxID=2800373 RepID=UPI00203C51C7|nr:MULTISPECIES: NADP-dependent oxidoreductase [Priestia]MCM3768950.1 NADP-dependent oxidoreductase [Priestia aryabhattai]MDY0942354.1 NADP-dependent oxidoreductase [Priestia megaterium]
MKTLMKAAQITKYSKNIHAQVNDIPIPKVDDNEVLVKVKAAAINPLEMLIVTGSVKLIQDYEFPLTLGNELAGIIEKVGKNVTDFRVGDAIYTRLPLEKIGALAEYVAIDAAAIAPMPKNLSYMEAAASALVGLTAYQGLHEELEAQPGKSVFIPGGSGSFGQMAVPIAKAMGLNVIVSGNSAARERTLEIGADQYLDYTTEHYVDLLSNVDFVIDTLGPKEFDNELSIIKPGGRLLSLRTGPNKRFGKGRNFPWWKQKLFSLAGAKFDHKAKKQDVEYHFIFVRSDGAQLREITKIIEKNNIIPPIHPTLFTIDNINEALELVANGRPKGKVIINF